MSELNLKIKSIALDDLENIANYIAKDNRQAAFIFCVYYPTTKIYVSLYD